MDFTLCFAFCLILRGNRAAVLYGMTHRSPSATLVPTLFVTDIFMGPVLLTSGIINSISRCDFSNENIENSPIWTNVTNPRYSPEMIILWFFFICFTSFGKTDDITGVKSLHVNFNLSALLLSTPMFIVSGDFLIGIVHVARDEEMTLARMDSSNSPSM